MKFPAGEKKSAKFWAPPPFGAPPPTPLGPPLLWAPTPSGPHPFGPLAPSKIKKIGQMRPQIRPRPRGGSSSCFRVFVFFLFPGVLLLLVSGCSSSCFRVFFFFFPLVLFLLLSGFLCRRRFWGQKTVPFSCLHFSQEFLVSRCVPQGAFVSALKPL